MELENGTGPLICHQTGGGGALILMHFFRSQSHVGNAQKLRSDSSHVRVAGRNSVWLFVERGDYGEVVVTGGSASHL